jgi:hypothetical protein
MPGRPQAALEVAELKGRMKHARGTYKKRRAKSRQPLGTAPNYLTEEEQKVWFEIESYAIQGTLRAPHRPILEITARLMAEFRRKFPDMATPRIGQLISCLGRLGLSPVDQQRLGLEKPEEEENPWAKLSNEQPVAQ